MTASPMALSRSTNSAPAAVRWERGMRLRVTPGVRLMRLNRSITTTADPDAQGLYLSGTTARAYVALERIGLVSIDIDDITPIT